MSKFDISLIWPELEITGLLGTGPFGEVYLAKNNAEASESWCALKIITMPPDGYNALVAAGKKPVINFAKYQNDLTWEMTMFKAVETPGLIKPEEMLLRRNPDDTGWVCVSRTELYTPLKDYFRKKAKIGDVVRMGQELCNILEKCSNLGLVHGDIKPENVFLDDDGKFFVGDFGIKRCLASAGTADMKDAGAYDAPEVENSGKFYAVSDIYSLGMTMAYLLNGSTMPTGKNINLIKCSNAELLKIIKKAVSYDPKDRYKNAGDMLAALERLGINITAEKKKFSAVEIACQKIKKSKTPEDFHDDIYNKEPGKIRAFLNRLKMKTNVAKK